MTHIYKHEGDGSLGVTCGPPWEGGPGQDAIDWFPVWGTLVYWDVKVMSFHVNDSHVGAGRGVSGKGLSNPLPFPSLSFSTNLPLLSPSLSLSLFLSLPSPSHLPPSPPASSTLFFHCQWWWHMLCVPSQKLRALLTQVSLLFENLFIPMLHYFPQIYKRSGTQFISSIMFSPKILLLSCIQFFKYFSSVGITHLIHCHVLSCSVCRRMEIHMIHYFRTMS